MAAQYIYFEESWNENKENKSDRGREVQSKRTKPVNKTKDDSKESRR